MKILEKISYWTSKYMAILVIIIAGIALFYPSTLSFIKLNYINTLLGVVMFGMGLTLKLSDFKIVFSRPRDVIIGCLLQFTIMPSLAFLLTKIFGLSTELAIGVVLVGTCPGGTSSNVMTYLAKGDVALSVGMTGVSTILAPFLTPLLTYLFVGQQVDVNIATMFLSIVKVIILPIILGFIINKLFSSITDQIIRILPLISVTAIMAIVASVVSSNAEKILSTGYLIMIVVIFHNICGYGLGWLLSGVLGMKKDKCKAVAIEVGMQNSGLAASLAGTHFAQYPLAAIPGAIFSVWHNISGAIFANILARKYKNEK